MKGVEGRLCEELTPKYYGLCAIGGMLSAGTTHLAITPLDVLKVNMQVHPIKYNSIASCFTTLVREQGPSALWRGWAGKFYGYGFQGGCRFGLYEYFKSLYSGILVDRNRSFVFFVSSASAEVFANLALCPFEAVKVQVQAQPSFAKGLADGFPKLYASEGILGFYRGLVPLLGRNIPFSMVMFSTFEHSVNFLFISNPADNIVASLYNKKAIRKIGFMNLFTRSLPIRMLLVGPVVTLQWLFYDTIKIMGGVPTSGEVATDLGIDEV
ncbi:Phosphate carrier protein mitochondrial-like [Quillaja saponaria]|uniref:Phosphate carrier protein mitochondrial-like n=1 Tax=Quillaja saponaria TaxID=32244 RepID=A0AAD7KQU9_QUISA|nr:Phosphate carrier protein mitochondrial-like [Quillaja saponaria]